MFAQREEKTKGKTLLRGEVEAWIFGTLLLRSLLKPLPFLGTGGLSHPKRFS